MYFLLPIHNDYNIFEKFFISNIDKYFGAKCGIFVTNNYNIKYNILIYSKTTSQKFKFLIIPIFLKGPDPFENLEYSFEICRM